MSVFLIFLSTVFRSGLLYQSGASVAVDEKLGYESLSKKRWTIDTSTINSVFESDYGQAGHTGQQGRNDGVCNGRRASNE